MPTTRLFSLILIVLLLIGLFIPGFSQAVEPPEAGEELKPEELGQSPDEILESSIVLKVGFSKALVRKTETPIDPMDRRVRPLILNKTAYVPARFIAEQLGASVSWNAKTTVTAITYQDNVIEFDLKEKMVKVNREVLDTGADPVILDNNRVLVPLRMLVETLGRAVSWDPSGLIIITDEALSKEITREIASEVGKYFIRRSAAELVKPSVVIGNVTQPVSVYSGQELRKTIGKLERGEKVEIIQDRNRTVYLVKSLSTGEKGWISAKYLSIPEDPPTNDQLMTEEEIEEYINTKGLSSTTAYLVWVDIDRQLTHVLLGAKGNWAFLRSMTCSTGTNKSPTVRGLFNIKDRGQWFYAPRFKSGAKNWVRFNGAYLFHSVPMDKGGNVIEKEAALLGKRASEGCIRISIEDSRWFYDYVAAGSTVYIN